MKNKEVGYQGFLIKEFGTKIRILRKNQGFTQAELAKKLNISTSTIGMYEQGRREPDNQTLLALAKTLKTTTDYLLCSSNNLGKTLNLNKIMSDFISHLENPQEVELNGKLIDPEQKKQIISFLKQAFELSKENILKNQKN